MIYRYFKWGILWSLFILFICAIPGNTLPKVSIFHIKHLDKIVHIVLFFVLYVFMTRGFKKIILTPRFYNNYFIFSFFYCILYGVLIEIIQHYFVVGRHADFNDVFADTGGVLFGVIIVELIKRE